MTENVEHNQEETAPAQEGNADLTINDLNALKTIIDIAISRGAFKGTEMTAIGQVYTKLDTFLTTVTEQAKAAAGAQ